MTFDVGGDLNFDPTVITSSNAQVTNICKNCGSQSLYSTKDDADRAKAQEAAKLREEEEIRELTKTPNLSWGRIFKKAVKTSIVVSFSFVFIYFLSYNESIIGEAATFTHIISSAFALSLLAFIFFFPLFSINYKGNDE